MLPSCTRHTRRAGVRTEGWLSDEAGGGRATMAQLTGVRVAVAPPMMALTAYLGRRLGGLRVRREQRLHHRHRCTVLSSAVEGRVPDLYVAHTASRGANEQLCGQASTARVSSRPTDGARERWRMCRVARPPPSPPAAVPLLPPVDRVAVLSRASRLQLEQTAERRWYTRRPPISSSAPPASAHSPSPRHETRPASPPGCALPRLAARGARDEQSKRRRSAAAEGRTLAPSAALPVAEGACGRPAGRHRGDVPRMAARERGRWPARRAQQRWCDMRRTPSFALAVACVISGRTSASGRLYVLVSRRLICSRGRSGAEGVGWDGRGVVSKGRGALGTAEDKELQLEGTAGRAGVRVVQGTW